MITNTNKNLKSQIIQNSTSIDSSLEELIVEAEKMFKVLDKVSFSIRHFEKRMEELHANFSFYSYIKSETESLSKDLADHHKDIQGAESFSTQTHWYLAWEPSDENSKKYRLFLIAQEKEIIRIKRTYAFHKYELLAKNIFKKPLLETDIHTRFKYAEHLNEFFVKFTSHLKNNRLQIEREKDDLPF